MLNERGHEVPDQTPVEVPTGLRRPPSIHEEIKRFIRSELSRQAQANEMETFEEADDFEIDDSEIDDLPTPYQLREPEEMLADYPEGNRETLDGTVPEPVQENPAAPAAGPQNSDLP